MTTYTVVQMAGSPWLIVETNGCRMPIAMFFEQTPAFHGRDAELACDALNKFQEKAKAWADEQANDAARNAANSDAQ